MGTENIVLVDLNFYDSGIREESKRTLVLPDIEIYVFKKFPKWSTSQHS